MSEGCIPTTAKKRKQSKQMHVTNARTKTNTLQVFLNHIPQRVSELSPNSKRHKKGYPPILSCKNQYYFKATPYQSHSFQPASILPSSNTSASGSSFTNDIMRHLITLVGTQVTNVITPAVQKTRHLSLALIDIESS